MSIWKVFKECCFKGKKRNKVMIGGENIKGTFFEIKDIRACLYVREVDQVEREKINDTRKKK